MENFYIHSGAIHFGLRGLNYNIDASIHRNSKQVHMLITQARVHQNIHIYIKISYSLE